MTTQYAEASYQEVIDLQTRENKVSIVGVHTPVGDAPYTFLQGFFDMFQRYRYLGCSLTLVPAARLPADISQVSYEGGSIPIDPRDLLNPILWHGCHGESLGSVLNQFLSGQGDTTDVYRQFFESGELNYLSTNQLGNDAVFESLYYRALTDKSWKKAHPQQGFRIRGLHPMVYSLGTNMQYVNGPTGGYLPTVPVRSELAVDPDSINGRSPRTQNGGQMGVNASGSMSVQGTEGLQTTNVDTGAVTISPNRSGSEFFSEKLHNLGWLDTRVRILASTQGVTTTGDIDDDREAIQGLYMNVEEAQRINYLPRLFMGVCLLPPAYKAEQYYRLVLNHRFAFKKFRGLSMRGERVGRFGPGNPVAYNNFFD